MYGFLPCLPSSLLIFIFDYIFWQISPNMIHAMFSGCWFPQRSMLKFWCLSGRQCWSMKVFVFSLPFEFSSVTVAYFSRSYLDPSCRKRESIGITVIWRAEWRLSRLLIIRSVRFLLLIPSLVIYFHIILDILIDLTYYECFNTYWLLISSEKCVEIWCINELNLVIELRCWSTLPFEFSSLTLL